MIPNWLFRLSMRLYPGGFREEYEGEMLRTFEALRGRDGAVSALLRSWWDSFAVGVPMQLQTLAMDLRQAARSLRSTPGLTLLIVLMMGLGVGANSAIYSVADALLFRSLPAPHADRLVMVQRAWNREALSLPDYRDLRDRAKSLATLAAYIPRELRWGSDNGGQERVSGELVTGNYFPALRLAAHRGRLIEPADDGAVGTGPVAVISHRLWATRFAARDDIVGQAIVLAGAKMTVIGVAEEGFHGSSQPVAAQVWIPLSMRNVVMPTVRSGEEDRGPTWLMSLGRLRDGAERGEVEAELNVIDEQIQAEHPEISAKNEAERHERHINVMEARGIAVPQLRRVAAGAAGLLLTASTFLLLIMCANTANLLLARGLARSRETAIRLALGSGRRRMLRQLLTESLLLSLLGAAAGVTLAYVTMAWLGDFHTPAGFGRQYFAFARIDLRVLMYALMVALATGVAFGFAPAGAAARVDVYGSLKDGASTARGGGRANRNLRQLLIGGQVALSVLLLAGCGMFLGSLSSLLRTPPRFATTNQTYLLLSFMDVDYDAGARARFLMAAKARLGEIPGVQAVALSDHPPLDVNNTTEMVRSPGVDVVLRLAANHVDEDYFRATQIPLLQGRAFQAADRSEGAPCSVIVNELFARRYWASGDALGRSMVFAAEPGRDCAVVGVAATHQYNSLAEAPQPAIYRPMRISDRALVIVRSAGPASASIAPLRKAVHQLDPAIEIRLIATAEDLLDLSRWPTRLGAQLLSCLALIGLLLTALGVYGVVSFLTSQRRHEIGVRIALGAQPLGIARVVVGMGIKLTAAGLAAGLLIATGVMTYLQSLLSGVSANDPWTYLAVTTVVLLTAVLATAIPAWRAARIDPLASLRAE